MSTLSFTAAIALASTHCAISGRGTSWHIYGPYRATDPAGPSTEQTASSYAKAVRIRTGWRANIALALMGRLDDESRYAADAQLQDPYAAHDLRSIVKAAAEQYTGSC